jgi:hypothetical protein
MDMKNKIKVYQFIVIFILPLIYGCPENDGISTSSDISSRLDEILAPPSINAAEVPEPRIAEGAEPTGDESEDSTTSTDRSEPCIDNPSGVEDAIALANSGLEVSEAAERGEVFKYYDKFISQGVPKTPLLDALRYFEKNQSKFENKNVISIADYSVNSKNKRFYLIDMKTGKVTKEVVAHGSGKRNGVRAGDPDHDGMLDKCVHAKPDCCQQKPGSTGYKSCVLNKKCHENMTRVGFMKINNPYTSSQNFPVIDSAGNNGIRIEGLEERNFEANGQGVVMHERWYVRGEGSVQGRSFGCPAFPPGKGAPLFKKIKGGSLYYSYAPQCN